MKVSIKDCEKLFVDSKFHEARAVSCELLYQNPDCQHSFLLLFHSSLSIGDDAIALVALTQLQQLGFKASTEEQERLKVRN
jgi:hypothetical protein